MDITIKSSVIQGQPDCDCRTIVSVGTQACGAFPPAHAVIGFSRLGRSCRPCKGFLGQPRAGAKLFARGTCAAKVRPAGAASPSLRSTGNRRNPVHAPTCADKEGVAGDASRSRAVRFEVRPEEVPRLACRDPSAALCVVPAERPTDGWGGAAGGQASGPLLPPRRFVIRRRGQGRPMAFLTRRVSRRMGS
jgi:hypothetical protein